jgi:hypothetical protein
MQWSSVRDMVRAQSVLWHLSYFRVDRVTRPSVRINLSFPVCQVIGPSLYSVKWNYIRAMSLLYLEQDLVIPVSSEPKEMNLRMQLQSHNRHLSQIIWNQGLEKTRFLSILIRDRCRGTEDRLEMTIFYGKAHAFMRR